MYNLFVKKVSMVFFVIGLITFLYQLIFFIFFFEKVRPIAIFAVNFIFIFVSLFGMLYGIKKQDKRAKLFQIIITFFVAFFSILSSPSNPAAMVFIVINFILLDEYDYLKNNKIKWSFVTIYLISFVISIIMSGEKLTNIIAHFLLSSFFFCFIFVYVICKQTQDVSKLKKCMKIINELKEDNAELIQITKEQLIANGRQMELLSKNSEELKKAINL